MERERPQYLPPIPRSRWEFPWLGAWAVILIGMAVAGAWLHFRTNDAWKARFTGRTDATQMVVPDTAARPSAREASEAAREATIAEIRLRRAAVDRADSERSQPDNLRCINGVAFRRIPGGWENVPNAHCP